jgi:hypothetical protein
MILRSGKIVNNNSLLYNHLITDEFNEFIKHLKFNTNNILDDAFYQQNDNNIAIIPFNDENEINEVRKYCDIHKDIPSEIKLLYMYIADKTIESNLGNFTFINFNEFVNMQNRNAERNRSFIDVALVYEGMGHLSLISYSPTHKMYFTRRDGGSNGYDCEDNDKYYDTYIPDVEDTKMIDFNTLIYSIINELI